VFLNYFNILILKIIFKKYIYYFNIFLKNIFKNNITTVYNYTGTKVVVTGIQVAAMRKLKLVMDPANGFKQLQH